MITTIRRLSAKVLRGVASRIQPSVNHISAHYQGHAFTDPFFVCLAQLGFSARNIVDIGANHGNWTRTAMHYFPNARFYLFEPQGELLAGSDLETMSNVIIFPMGVGPKTAKMKLSKHSRDDSFSFALSEQEAAMQGREQIDVPVVALDEFLSKENYPSPDILKIDAEGWDLEVLKGAEDSVKNSEVVLLEAAVLNKGFPNKLELVVCEMAKRGFVPFDITDLNRTNLHRALWLVELAFVKKGGLLDSKITSYE